MPFGDDFETSEEHAGGPRPATGREVFSWREKPSPAGMPWGVGASPAMNGDRSSGVLPVTAPGRSTLPGLAPRETMCSPSSPVCNLHAQD